MQQKLTVLTQQKKQQELEADYREVAKFGLIK